MRTTHYTRDHNDLKLTNTKRLIELMRGKTKITFIPPDNMTLSVFLPFDIPETKAKEKPRGLKQYTGLAGKKILLVEDNKINQLVVGKMLRKLGVEITTADNGFEALEALEFSYFDLILMDIQMPGMDGYRATSEIRKLADPLKRGVPIVALTATSVTDRDKAKLFQMDDAIGKPFGPENLLDTIEKYIPPSE